MYARNHFSFAYALAAMLLLCALPLAIEPYSEGNSKTFISLSVFQGQIAAQLTYADMRMLAVPDEEQYPDSPTEFHQPLDVADNELSATSEELKDAIIHMYFDDQPIDCGTGTMGVAPPTNDNGITTCALPNTITSCGLLTANFGGEFDDGAGHVVTRPQYQHTSASVAACPPINYALSALGPAIYAAFSNGQNALYCFPLMLIAGLLMASMYYSGRDPLSLFDLTTPRLPKVRQFRVKAGTAPQMMRSVTRRYALMKDRAEKNIIGSMRAAAMWKAASEGKSRREQKAEARKQAAEARKIFDQYKKELAASSASKKPMTKEQLLATINALNALLDRNSPGANASKAKQQVYGRSRELIGMWLQVHHASQMASDIMSGARGGGGGPISRMITNRVVNPLTVGMTKFEQLAPVRFIGRVPFLRGIVAGPTKAADVLIQWRASRRGHKTFRREQLGALAYNTLLTRKAKGDEGAPRQLSALGRGVAAALSEKSPLGKFASKWYKWSWADFEKSKNINTRKSNNLLDKREEIAIGEAKSFNDWFIERMRAMSAGLTLAGSLEELKRALEKDQKRASHLKKQLIDRLATLEKAPGKSDTIKKEIKRLEEKIRIYESAERMLGKISSAASNAIITNPASMKYLEGELKRMVGDSSTKKIAASTAEFFQKSERMAQKVERVAGDFEKGKIDAAAAYERMWEIASGRKINDMGYKAGRAARGVLAELRSLERELQGMCVYREKGLYKVLKFDYIDNDRAAIATSDEKVRKALSSLREQYSKSGPKALEAFDKKTMLEKLEELRNTGAISDKLYAGILERMAGSVSSKYGEKYASMDRAEFDRKLNEAYAQILKNAAVDKKGKPTGKFIAERLQELNDRIDAAADTRNLSLEERLLRTSGFGADPVARYLTARLRELGIVDKDGKHYDIRSMNDIEILMNRKDGTASSLHFLQQLDAAAQRDRNLAKAIAALQGKPEKGRPGREAQVEGVRVGDRPQAAYNVLLSDAGRFALRFEAQLWNSANAFSGGENSRRKALSDFLNAGASMEILAALKPYERKDLAVQKVEFGSSRYDSKVVETNMLIARAYDQMAGFIASKNLPEASWGANSLGRMRQVMEENRDHLGRLRAFYVNLTTQGGKYYDAGFAEKMGGKEFNAESFGALIARGVTFGDLKRGLPFMLSGDMRGGMPLLEWKPEYLRAMKGNDNIVIGQKETPNYAPLLARTMDSKYVNLPSNLVFLIRHQDGDKTAWVYGTPGKDQVVGTLMGAAENNPNLRENLAKALSGTFDKDGNFDPSKARIMAVSAHDYRKFAVKDRPAEWGELTTLATAKEYLRTKAWGAGGWASNILHSGVATRVEKMESWFAAQAQMRFVLDSLSRSTKGYMTAGSDRFRAYSDDGDKARFMDELRRESASLREMEDEREREIFGRLSGLASQLERGDNTAKGNREASWWNFRRGVASKTLDVISEAETGWYNAKMQLKALEKMRQQNEVTAGEYAAFKSALNSKYSEYNADYKNARKEFESFNKSVIEWTASHPGAGYGSEKNPFTMWGIFSKYLDSKWVQGRQMDFYWTTEAGAMRDPRLATGAGYGLDFSFYVGYQTGQNVYERSSFWTTNSLWERSMDKKLLLSLGVHKLFNDYISFMAREGSAYPAWFEMDPLHPGRHGKRNKAAILAPLMSHYHTDFWQARAQSAINYSGAGALVGAYMQSGETHPHDRSFAKKALDWMFLPSSHYNEAAQWRGLQRPREQFEQFERKMDRILAESPVYREKYIDWLAAQEGTKEKADLWQHYFDPIVSVYDRRPHGVRKGHSGRDIQEDGSRNRYMELYSAFFINTWRPTIPGLQDTDVLSGQWRPFSHTAARANRSEGKPLGALGHFYSLETDEKGMVSGVHDRLSTHEDAYRDVFRREDNALFHLLKLENERFAYSAINSPALFFLSPVAGALYQGVGKWPGLINLRPNSQLVSTVSKGPEYTGDMDKVYGGGRIQDYNQYIAETVGYGLDELAPMGGPTPGYLARKGWALQQFYRRGMSRMPMPLNPEKRGGKKETQHLKNLPNQFDWE